MEIGSPIPNRETVVAPLPVDPNRVIIPDPVPEKPAAPEPEPAWDPETVPVPV